MNGELGQGGLEDPNIAVPTEVKFTPVKVLSIAVGGRHSLMLTEDGNLYSCGSNDFGQLGREGSQTRLEQVTSLAGYTVKQIAAGTNHSFAVDEWGSLFSWGSDEYGQLGHNQGSQSLRTPRLVKSLGTIKVSTVYAGMYHSLALTAGGQLYAWGSNGKGQLGVGATPNMLFTPTLVSSLRGVPLAGATCGGNHSMVVSVSGAVFSFGSNNHGQLGLGDEEDRYLPTQIRTLRYQNIANGGLSAGSEHSIALTREGGVFTWGSSRCGQLGHGTNSVESVPRRVLELMGTIVTQVSAGDRYTLALVPSRNKLYAFGVGGSGQLGRGPENTQNVSLPQMVNGEFEGKICLISAGGNSSWLSVSNKELSQLTYPAATSLLTQPLLQQIQSIQPDVMMDQDLMTEVELIFSSLSCINGSLLLPDHSGCKGSNAGIDHSGWRNAFTIIEQCPNETVSSIVTSGLKSIISELKPDAPDVEALRFYLILPHYLSESRPDNVKELEIPFAEAMLSLKGNAGKVIEKWLKASGTPMLLHLIRVYKAVAIPFLKMLNTDHTDGSHVRPLKIVLLLLTFLFRLNSEVGSLIPLEAFYIENLHQYCDLKHYYLLWKLKRMNNKDTTLEPAIYICNYPFIFDPIAKEIILKADQALNQQIAQQTELQSAMFQMFTSGQGSVQPYLEIIVGRDTIVQDTINQLFVLHNNLGSNLRKPLRVTFKGEEAEDEGGVTKEFFLLLIKEILNPDYGMFKEYEETNAIWFSPASLESEELFNVIGIVCGLAIYNFTIINLPFPLALYKKVQGQPTQDISDFADLSPMMAKSLQDLLDYSNPDVEDVFSLSFTIDESYFGEVVSTPLKPGGENMNVTNENKEEYVRLYVDYVLNKACSSQFEAFKKGFLKVVNNQILQLFQPKELMSLVIGNENYNWGELEANCEYKDPYSKDHPTIQFFWQAFRELDEGRKRKFLLFLTGSDRIPARGMEAVKLTIQRAGDTAFLPVAHTCFNLLDLPEYGTKERLLFKLKQAIEETKGFGIV